MQEYLLSLLILTPLAGAFAALCIPSGSERVFRMVALISGIIQVLVLAQLITHYSPSESLQFVEQRPWITLDLGSWGVLKAEYFV
ncbi:MAG: NADH-quinone oxidoreductase subunit M, partial [Bacteroidota bacterium]|nr:NADH-quinone oxidoreductase subunit M [Bacteroidota bacterium]